MYIISNYGIQCDDCFRDIDLVPAIATSPEQQALLYIKLVFHLSTTTHKSLWSRSGELKFILVELTGRLTRIISWLDWHFA